MSERKRMASVKLIVYILLCTDEPFVTSLRHYEGDFVDLYINDNANDILPINIRWIIHRISNIFFQLKHKMKVPSF